MSTTRKKKTRVLFMKYHEAADQQPLSQKAAEKLGIFPSLPLLGLAAYVRQDGFPVHFIDMHSMNLETHEAEAMVREIDPHVVALTAKTLGWPAVIEIAQMVRANCPKALIVVGGPHLTLYAKESLTWDCFDVAVIGDGEEPFLEICQAVEAGWGVEGIPGTLVRNAAGELIESEARKLPKDIDKYPMSAWDLVDINGYHCLTLLKPFATMVTTSAQVTRTTHELLSNTGIY